MCVHLPVTLRHIVTWDHTATTSETTTTTTTMTAPDPFLPVTLHSSPAERVAVAEVSKVSVTGEGGEVAVHLQQLGSAMRVLARNLGTLVDHVRAVARGEISASSCPEVLRGVAGLVNQLPHVARVEGGPGREMRAAVLTALLPQLQPFFEQCAATEGATAAASEAAGEAACALSPTLFAEEEVLISMPQEPR